MTAWVHDMIKTDIKDIVYEALKAAANEKRYWFENDGDSFDNFLRAIRIKQVESDGECSMPSQKKVPGGDNSTNDSDQASHKESERHQGQSESVSLTPQVASPVQRGSINDDSPNVSASTSALSWCSFHSHRIHLCIRRDYRIGICSLRLTDFQFNSKLADEPFRETFRETVIGMATGLILGGAVIGSTIPADGDNVGSILGAVVGGIIGYKGATFSSTSDHRHVPNDHIQRAYETIDAVEVFKKLDEFSVDRDRNMCYCVITTNTACPYQEYAAEERERVWRAI